MLVTNGQSDGTETPFKTMGSRNVPLIGVTDWSGSIAKSISSGCIVIALLTMDFCEMVEKE